MNIYFYIFTEKVHQYDVQCIMTGGLFSCHQKVKKRAHETTLLYRPWTLMAFSQIVSSSENPIFTSIYGVLTQGTLTFYRNL